MSRYALILAAVTCALMVGSSAPAREAGEEPVLTCADGAQRASTVFATVFGESLKQLRAQYGERDPGVQRYQDCLAGMVPSAGVAWENACATTIPQMESGAQAMNRIVLECARLCAQIATR